MSKLILSPLLVICVVGCVTDPDVPDDNTTYTRTIVRFADDGSATVATEPITAAEQRLEHEAAVDAIAGIKPRTLAIDSCGDWYATKFFDKVNYTGNELCLIGDGYDHLAAYCRLHYRGICVATWTGGVRSFWTGELKLTLAPDYGTPGCPWALAETFPPYEADTSLDECAQVATEFWIFPPQ
jgi:hypothetical protein